MIDVDAPDSGPERGWPERVLWWGRSAGLVALAVAAGFSHPRPGVADARALASLVLLLVALLTAITIRVCIVRRSPRPWLLGNLLGLILCSCAFAWVVGSTPALAFGLVAVGYASTVLPIRVATAVTTGIVVVTGAGLLWHEETTLAVLIVPIAAANLLGGIARRSYSERVENAELAVAQAERARVAENRSGALAERSRIARDIHDVLAHSLAALSMQLEAADAVLAAGDIERGRQAVGRARALAREGMLETRRAVSALRTGLAPLPEALSELAATAGGPAEVAVSGPPRELEAPVQLALYRTAQESVANATKHAPGAPIDLCLAYSAESVTLTVCNGPARDRDRPITDTGAGMGLVGMRERIQDLRGSLEAGPSAGGWRVHVRIPA